MPKGAQRQGNLSSFKVDPAASLVCYKEAWKSYAQSTDMEKDQAKTFTMEKHPEGKP
jgi:hypothetical protein